MGGDGVVIDGQDNTCGLVPTFPCKKMTIVGQKKMGTLSKSVIRNVSSDYVSM
jgi:hypothetical protein